MHCLNCEAGMTSEDQIDDSEPYQCESCGQWMVIEVDEGTYEGAVKKNIIMLEEDDLDNY